MNFRRLAVVLLAVAAFGWARMSFESQLTRDFRKANFFLSQLNMDVREQTSQMGFVAALSGVRAPLADIIWSQTADAFANTNWGKLKLLMDAAVTLQPRSTLFWDNASWHMAWNASVNAMQDTDKRPKEIDRLRASQQYMEVGEDYLMRGIGFNWDRAKLFESLGLLYLMRFQDHAKASWAYFEAAKRPDVAGYVYRGAVYELAKVPGKEVETLRLLREIYYKNDYTPTSLSLLDELQKKLNVPKEEWIDTTKAREEVTPKRAPRK